MGLEYKSSVLRCNVEEDGCAVCEFLSGFCDEKTLLAVIRILDAKLAQEEEYSRGLCEVIGVYNAKEKRACR